jgi:hypothetical protein
VSSNAFTPASLKAAIREVVLEILAEQGLTATAAVPVQELTPEQEKRVEAVVDEAEKSAAAAVKAARKSANREAAAWMREKGLVPSGQAWVAVKNGERNVVKLRKLNAADTPAKAKAEPKAEVVAEPEVKAPPKKAVAKKAPAKAAPAKKAVAKKAPARRTTTRKAATTKAAEASPEAVAEVPQGADPNFTESTLETIANLRAKGLSDEEIVLALAEQRKQQG